MSDYKLALSHQEREESCYSPPSLQSKTFANANAFYSWLHQETEMHQRRIAENANSSTCFSKKHVELLDLVESDVIDFLFELREEFGIQYSLPEFLDRVILPNISINKVDDVEDEEDSGIIDE